MKKDVWWNERCLVDCHLFTITGVLESCIMTVTCIYKFYMK